MKSKIPHYMLDLTDIDSALVLYDTFLADIDAIEKFSDTKRKLEIQNWKGQTLCFGHCKFAESKQRIEKRCRAILLQGSIRPLRLWRW